MFEALRKYGSVVMLILTSMVLVCFVANEYGDTQKMANTTYASVCMAVVDDLELDDNDEDEDEDGDEDENDKNHFYEGRIFGSIQLIGNQCYNTKNNKCSKAILRGQVRRYSPRNNLSSSHNYTLLSIIKSGVDLFHATFFYTIHSIINQNTNLK